MTRTKSQITSDTVEFYPHNFNMTKTSSTYAKEIAESQLIHAIENPTPS